MENKPSSCIKGFNGPYDDGTGHRCNESNEFSPKGFSRDTYDFRIERFVMMSTAPSPAVPPFVKSSLEEMLDLIRRRDEQPKDVPPALPSRPISRGRRLPSPKRSLPINFNVRSNLGERVSNGSAEKQMDQVNDTATLTGIKAEQPQVSPDEQLPTVVENYGESLLQDDELELVLRRNRAVITIQKHVKRQIAQRKLDDQKKAAVCLQSGVRGWMEKKQFLSRHLEHSKKLPNGLPETMIHGLNNKDPQVHHSVLEELQMRVLRTEAALRQKEEENSILLQKLHQYERRWSQYESNIKSMEETWQKQMTALQASLAAARKSIATDDTAHQNRKCDFPTSPLYYESEDTISFGVRTPQGTPGRPPRQYECGIGKISEAGDSALNEVLREFEQRKQVFEDDAQYLVEGKYGQSRVITNHNAEFRKLKLRFTIWKKEYNARLRETKMTLQKVGNLETEKPWIKWWARRT